MTCNLFTTCIFFCPNLPCDSLKKPLNCASLPTCGFAAQLVRELNQYLGGMGSIPVEALIFLPRLLFCNCLNCSSPPNIIAFLELIVLHGKGDLNGRRMEISLHTVLFLLLLYSQVRCKATLEVMRHAMIPWSESVEKLVSEFMAAYPK